MNSVNVDIPLAPYELCRVKRRYNVEKQSGTAFDGLQHEIRHGPHVLLSQVAGVITVTEAENNQQASDRPERDFMQDGAHAHSQE